MTRKASSAAQQSALSRPVQQIDLDGVLHDVAPATRQERLFAPAPNQLAGQTHLDTDTSNERPEQ